MLDTFANPALWNVDVHFAPVLLDGSDDTNLSGSAPRHFLAANKNWLDSLTKHNYREHDTFYRYFKAQGNRGERFSLAPSGVSLGCHTGTTCWISLRSTIRLWATI
jgi:hypothetical protein